MATPHTINGLQGTLSTAITSAKNDGTFERLWWTVTKGIQYHGDPATMRVTVRFDDRHANGHNTFSITADITSPRGRDIAGGCLHDVIEKEFPELAHLIKWHLCSTNGPMHYEANTLYNAGDRDHYGRRKGDPSVVVTSVRFGNSPIRHPLTSKFAKWLQDPDVRFEHLEVLRIDHRDRETFGPKFTFGGFDDEWHRCPFDSEREALEWLEALQGPHEFETIATAWSEGKERDLDRARQSAIWPDATDEELSVEREELRERLRNRLPALLAEFRAAVESCGFLWEAEKQER